ncbi:MAG: type II secretion system GspH family protein [bacterium]|nr:type II secretion system GspH family protein [bacterium]
MVNTASLHRRRAKQSGTTLAELLVTMFLFTLIVGTIMTFYMQSTRVTTQQDSISDAYRRAITIADKIDTYTAYAKIYKISDNYIVFSPPDTDNPIKNGLPQWQAPQVLKIVRKNKKVFLQLIGDDAKTSNLMELPSTDTVVFSKGSHMLCIDVSCKASKTKAHHIQISRSVFLDNSFSF